MSKIFISYRREDSGGWAGRLADRLRAKFGGEQIFMDVDTLKPGVDFEEAIRRAVGSCDVLLAVIGRTWLTVADSQGLRRLDNPHDYIRLEIATALARKAVVIPVLVDGASIPPEAQLPENLSSLAKKHAIDISDKRWHADTQQLINSLENDLRGAPEPHQPAARSEVGHETHPEARRSLPRRLAKHWAALVTIVVISATLYFLGTPGGDESRQPADLPPDELTDARLQGEFCDSLQFILDQAATSFRPVRGERLTASSFGLRTRLVGFDNCTIYQPVDSSTSYTGASIWCSNSRAGDPLSFVEGPGDVRGFLSAKEATIKTLHGCLGSEGYTAKQDTFANDETIEYSSRQPEQHQTVSLSTKTLDWAIKLNNFTLSLWIRQF